LTIGAKKSVVVVMFEIYKNRIRYEKIDVNGLTQSGECIYGKVIRFVE